MKEEELDPARVMRIVDHPVRMRIIELLAKKGPLSWKDLSAELGTGTGSLYHHLDTLEKIVARDSSRRYVLTPVGEEVFAKLSSIPSRSLSRYPHEELGRGSGGLSSIVAPRSLLRLMTSTPARSVASLAILSAIVLGISIYTGIEVVLFAFVPSPGPVIGAGSFLGSLLLVAGISYVSSRVLFRQTPELLTLISAISLSFLPMAGLSLLLNYLVKAGTLGLLADRTALTVFVALFQGWSVIVLSSGASVASGLRIEKTLIVGLILLYISMSVLFIQGRIL